MARGGKRAGAGRKAGTVGEATQRRKAVAERALAEGISPLDVMLTTMRGLWAEAIDDDGRLVDMGKAIQANTVAKDAAPFVHPKLSSVEAKVDVDAEVSVSEIRWTIVDPEPPAT